MPSHSIDKYTIEEKLADVIDDAELMINTLRGERFYTSEDTIPYETSWRVTLALLQKALEVLKDADNLTYG